MIMLAWILLALNVGHADEGCTNEKPSCVALAKFGHCYRDKYKRTCKLACNLCGDGSPEQSGGASQGSPSTSEVPGDGSPEQSGGASQGSPSTSEAPVCDGNDYELDGECCPESRVLWDPSGSFVVECCNEGTTTFDNQCCGYPQLRWDSSHSYVEECCGPNTIAVGTECCPDERVVPLSQTPDGVIYDGVIYECCKEAVTVSASGSPSCILGATNDAAPAPAPASSTTADADVQMDTSRDLSHMIDESGSDNDDKNCQTSMFHNKRYDCEFYHYESNVASALDCGYICGEDPACKYWNYGTTTRGKHAKKCYMYETPQPMLIPDTSYTAGTPCTRSV